MSTRSAMLYFFVVVAIGVGRSSGVEVGDEKWFEQYLDHFNARDNRTFWMKYYEMDEYFVSDGPLLVEIGGEVTLDPAALVTSPAYDVARSLGGKIVLLEHRYYGSSAPFDNVTDTEEYAFLSAEQALEDIAYFIQKYKAETGMNTSKVAVFGCSYAGTLATWMRYKFPHLVDAAWASSAPVRVVLDFYQYYEVAGEFYSNVSAECVAMVRQGYRETRALLSTTDGAELVRAAFDDWECGDVAEMGDQEILAVVRMVLSNQYGRPNHGEDSCRFLQSKNETTTPFEQLAALVREKSAEVCFDEDLDDVMAWTYQTCTQFGFSFTTSSFRQPFRDPYSAIDADLKYCADAFGDEFDLQALRRSIERTNRVYGGVDLQVTRVITMHGNLDPWSKMGLRESREEAPVFVVPGASHCADTSGGEPEWPPLTRAKARALEIMTKWLQ